MHADHGQAKHTASASDAVRLFSRALFTHSPLRLPPRISFCQTLRSRVLQAAAAGAVPTKTAPQPISSSHAPIRALSQAHA